MERVRSASDQVAIQLRDMIVAGVLPDGARLPSEMDLARQSGVSRATIREALQMLGAEGLTQTKRGPHGGTFVTLPSPDDVMDTLRFGVTLLSRSNGLTLANLLEMRELLEVRAAGLAADRRTDEDLEWLRAAVPVPEDGRPSGQNVLFHRLLLAAARNPLLSIAAQPIQHVLVAQLPPDIFGPQFRLTIHAQHADILEAIERQDAEAAQQSMQEHLDWLRSQQTRVLGETI